MNAHDQPRILVIEDEQHIQRALRHILTENGYAVNVVGTAADGIAHAAAEAPDVVLLDLALPDMGGIAVCAELRGWSNMPIIVLSADDQQHSKVRALDAGADDYLTKPFGVSELLARIRVALRHRAMARGESAGVVSAGSLQIDLAHHSVVRDGLPVRLTATEFKLLAFLARHADRVLTHKAILTEVWGDEGADRLEYLRVYMRQLRAKLEQDPHNPVVLITEPGIGYRLSRA